MDGLGFECGLIRFVCVDLFYDSGSCGYGNLDYWQVRDVCFLGCTRAPSFVLCGDHSSRVQIVGCRESKLSMRYVLWG